MNLSSLSGNARIKQHLGNVTDGDGLSHAYIVSGVTGSGRHILATILISATLCDASGDTIPCGSCSPCKKIASGIHPDVIYVGRDNIVSVGDVRALRSDAYVRPNEGKRKTYLIEQADKMKDSAQNALLKLLEDGPKYAQFILIAENSEALLPTLRSRCEVLALDPVELQVDEVLSGHANTLFSAIMSGDELRLFEAGISMDKLEREQTIKVLSLLQSALTSAIPTAQNPRLLMRGAELCSTLQGVAEFNVGTSQLLGWFTAELYSGNI